MMLAYVALIIGGLALLLVLARLVQHKSNIWKYAYAVAILAWVLVVAGPLFWWPYAACAPTAPLC